MVKEATKGSVTVQKEGTVSAVQSSWIPQLDTIDIYIVVQFTHVKYRVKRDGADCVLGAGNQFSAPGSYQECPNELYFEVGHSINKFKFSGTVLVASWSWNLVSSIKNAVSTHTLYSTNHHTFHSTGLLSRLFVLLSYVFGSIV